MTPRPTRYALVASLACAALAACGGKATDPGGGDAGLDAAADAAADVAPVDTGIEATIDAPPPDAAVDAASCDALRAALADAVAAAIACDPKVSSLQCTGMTVITDACSCKTAANDKRPELAAQANAIWQEAQARGCLLACGRPCFGDAMWACIPDATGVATCQPAFE